MNEALKYGSPVNKARRVTGLILIVLGVTCWVLMGWLLVRAGRALSHDNWVRFSIGLWTGVLLSLVGCWLAYRSRVAAGAAVAWIAVLFAMAYVHDNWLR
jgi:hypothetical protein